MLSARRHDVITSSHYHKTRILPPKFDQRTYISARIYVLWFDLKIKKECIPVGCVPPAAMVISPATHTSPLPCMPPAMHAAPPTMQTPPAMHASPCHARPPPPVNRITDACEHITLPQLRRRR